MRIGFDAKRLFCNATGLGNYSRSLVRSLTQFVPGNEYVLYTPDIRLEDAAREFGAGNPFRIVRPGKGKRMLWRTFGIPGRLNRDGIELYHGLSNELPLGITRSGIPSVVTVHDLIFRHYPRTYPALDRKIYDLKMRHACHAADRVIAISENTRQDICTIYGIPDEKVTVVYQSCQEHFYHAGAPGREMLQQYGFPPEYILSVGRIEARKNLELLVDAYALLHPAGRPPLVIVGKDGGAGRRLLKRISDLGLNGEVTIIGNLQDNTHLKAAYRNALVFVYPSVYEGFGLPVVEALLSGAPVITSGTSSLPEAGGPDSLYFDPRNAEQLAHCLSKVLLDNVLRDKMILAGHAYAQERFNPLNTSRALFDVYSGLVG